MAKQNMDLNRIFSFHLTHYSQQSTNIEKQNRKNLLGGGEMDNGLFDVVRPKHLCKMKI